MLRGVKGIQDATAYVAVGMLAVFRVLYYMRSSSCSYCDVKLLGVLGL